MREYKDEHIVLGAQSYYGDHFIGCTVQLKDHVAGRFLGCTFIDCTFEPRLAEGDANWEKWQALLIECSISWNKPEF